MKRRYLLVLTLVLATLFSFIIPARAEEVNWADQYTIETCCDYGRMVLEVPSDFQDGNGNYVTVNRQFTVYSEDDNDYNKVQMGIRVDSGENMDWVCSWVDGGYDYSGQTIDVYWYLTIYDSNGSTLAFFNGHDQHTCEPTAVTFVDTGVDTGPEANKVWWETATEIETVGFFVHRATTDVYTDAVCLNPDNIISASLGMVGQFYEYTDDTAFEDFTYHYWLRELESNGGENVYYMGENAWHRPLLLSTPVDETVNAFELVTYSLSWQNTNGGTGEDFQALRFRLGETTGLVNANMAMRIFPPEEGSPVWTAQWLWSHDIGVEDYVWSDPFELGPNGPDLRGNYWARIYPQSSYVVVDGDMVTVNLATEFKRQDNPWTLYTNAEDVLGCGERWRDVKGSLVIAQ